MSGICLCTDEKTVNIADNTHCCPSLYYGNMGENTPLNKYEIEIFIMSYISVID